MCPDLRADSKLQLKGEVAAMHSKRILFNIDKCNNTRRYSLGQSPCKEDFVIKSFIKDVMVDTWVMQK